jgi:hypothetical protein
MKRDSIRRGQGTLEYSMVIICIVAALLAMQYYIKRAIQGRVRESADTIGEQYGPRHMDSQITITQTGTTDVKVQAIQDPNDADKFGLETIANTDETTTRTGHENVGKFEENLFD